MCCEDAKLQRFMVCSNSIRIAFQASHNLVCTCNKGTCKVLLRWHRGQGVFSKVVSEFLNAPLLSMTLPEIRKPTLVERLLCNSSHVQIQHLRCPQCDSPELVGMFAQDYPDQRTKPTGRKENARAKC